MKFTFKIKTILSLCSLFFFTGADTAKAKDISFEQCEKVFLGGKRLSTFITEEKSKEGPDQRLVAQMESIKSCSALLKSAALKQNGLLQDRNIIAHTILDTFNQQYAKWLMPVDLDRAPRCSDSFQWDVYDKLSPAYHMVRSIFQSDRNISAALTAYGDLRIVRKGDDPTTSLATGLEARKYEVEFGEKSESNPFAFIGDGEILGYLYQKNFMIPLPKLTGKLKEELALRNLKNLKKNTHNIREHLGGGLLGSPSYLYFHSHQAALSEADGKRELPRDLAKGIFETLLCSGPESFYDENTPIPTYTEGTSWKHPITQEKNCLGCHLPLDQMAAGMRGLTFMPTSSTCAKEDLQVQIPVLHKTDHSQDIWQRDSQNFASSYPVGYFQGKRFSSFAQLGKLIAEDSRFYSCQVKRLYKWITEESIDDELLSNLTKSFQSHQNGMRLLNDILSHAPKEAP